MNGERASQDAKASAKTLSPERRTSVPAPKPSHALWQQLATTPTPPRVQAKPAILTHVIQQGSGSSLRRQPKSDSRNFALEINTALETPLSTLPLELLNGLEMSHMLTVLQSLYRKENRPPGQIELGRDPLDLILGRMPSGLGEAADRRMRAAITAVKLSRARRQGADAKAVEDLARAANDLAASIPHRDQQEAIRTQSLMVRPGTYGLFKNAKTSGLNLWNYLVYPDHVRLGNRAIGDQQVIGSLPWMTNNPGDLTVDIQPPKDRKQETRVYEMGAMRGVAARTDLAIFPEMTTGQEALEQWIKKYYQGQTVAAAVSSHLGSSSTYTKVDDPTRYAKDVQAFIDNRKKYPINIFTTTIDDQLKPGELHEIALAMGSVEGAQNIGIIYTCQGRDERNDSMLETWKAQHPLVRALPRETPPEIRALLGCIEERGVQTGEP